MITRPEESYRPWCVVVCDLETSRMRRPWPALGRSATKKKKHIIGPPSYMRSVVDRNVVMRRTNVQGFVVRPYLLNTRNPFLSGIRCNSNKPLWVWRKGKKYKRTTTAWSLEDQKSMTALFYPMLPDIRKRIPLCKASQASPVRPSDNTDMRCITTFRSTMDRIYDGGPIILHILLLYYNIIL